MTDPTPAPDHFHRFLQAMPRLALISGLIATALHLYLGPSLSQIVSGLIAGSLISGIILAYQHYHHPYLISPSVWIIAMAGYRLASPHATDLLFTQFTLDLFRYFSTLLTFHALTLLLFTHPQFCRLTRPLFTPLIRIRNLLARLWKKLIEVPPRPE